MPPPKVKLHYNSGKSSRIPKDSQIHNPQNNAEPQSTTSTTTSSPAVNSVTGLTAEQEQQFQLELYWCIQQFQKALSSGKLATKQVQDHTKALNTLMSNAVPMVKKRQVMRLSFGDYRTKMLEDERKAKKLSVKIGTGKPSDKSVFYKKAIITSTGNDFRFNFPTPMVNDPNEGELSGGPLVEKLKLTPPTVNNGIFTKSDNTFRFNFSNEIEDENNSQTSG